MNSCINSSPACYRDIAATWTEFEEFDAPSFLTDVTEVHMHVKVGSLDRLMATIVKS
jgi:hypothetical protein